MADLNIMLEKLLKKLQAKELQEWAQYTGVLSTKIDTFEIKLKYSYHLDSAVCEISGPDYFYETFQETHDKKIASLYKFVYDRHLKYSIQKSEQEHKNGLKRLEEKLE